MQEKFIQVSNEAREELGENLNPFLTNLMSFLEKTDTLAWAKVGKSGEQAFHIIVYKRLK